MLHWIKRRISLKIAIALFIVLSLIMSGATWLLVKSRSEALRRQMSVRAKNMALLGAGTMELILNQAVRSGTISLKEIFPGGSPSTGPVPKNHPLYGRHLVARIAKIQDVLVRQDPSVVYAVLVDRNGRPLAGNPQRGRLLGPATGSLEGPAAARHDGSGGGKVLRQKYRSATGEVLWDVAAPVSVQGRHWGTFRIGFSTARVEAAIAHLRNSLILYMLIVELISFLTIYLILAFFIRPLNRLTLAADRIAEGHLDQRIELESEDEIGQLGRAFNRMTQVVVKDLEGEMEKGNRLVGSVKEAIHQLSSSANEITAVSTQLSAGATQQASAVQEATTTSEEIAVTARQVAEVALHVEARADQASEASSGGMQAVADAVEGMGRLRGQVGSIAEAMLELGENSQKIGGIVDIIDEISDQTNLLALNAAIEAAGAGEAGKRFSIVATEVKRLAGRTVEATGQIKGLIEIIQKATNSTIMLTEEGAKGVQTAGSLVGRVSEALSNILSLVQETAGSAREIKLATQQQTSASEQMAETIAEIRDVAAQVAAGSEETAQSIVDLTRLAEELRDLLETGLQEKGRSKAAAGARMLEGLLDEMVGKGLLSVEDLFDENYVPIPGSDPQKYHTRYDAYLDETIADLLDSYLKDNQVVFAILADRNGYVPTHNSKYSRPLTGDPEIDRKWNRTKRMFNDEVGLAAAHNPEGVLVQVYERDTGEKMWDISAPVVVEGRHWGAFRLGYCM